MGSFRSPIPRHPRAVRSTFLSLKFFTSPLTHRTGEEDLGAWIHSFLVAPLDPRFVQTLLGDRVVLAEDALVLEEPFGHLSLRPVRLGRLVDRRRAAQSVMI